MDERCEMRERKGCEKAEGGRRRRGRCSCHLEHNARLQVAYMGLAHVCQVNSILQSLTMNTRLPRGTMTAGPRLRAATCLLHYSRRPRSALPALDARLLYHRNIFVASPSITSAWHMRGRRITCLRRNTWLVLARKGGEEVRGAFSGFTF